MEFTTVALLLVAAFLHASWHALVKSGSDQLTVLAGMGLVSSAMAAVALPFVAMPPVAAWLVLVVSVVLHVTYRLCLASAYRRSDLSQAFPLARGMIPLFATAIAFLTLNQVPSTGQWLCIGGISIGICFLAAEQLANRANWQLVLAACGAGAAVAGYSVLDAYGTQIASDWAGFTAWLILIDNATFLVLTRLIKGKDLWYGLIEIWSRVLVSGVIGVLSFSVYLWALSRNPVGATSALRETSVMFAMVIGVMRYDEPFSLRRFFAAAIIVGGIITLVAI